jgi:Protein of unknown function (DUF2946)
VPLPRAFVKHLAVLAWLALFALTLLPSLARVVNAATQSGWVEICSAQGMRWVAPDGTLFERGPGGQSAAHGEQCPLCGGAGATALPITTVMLRPAAVAARFVAPLFLHAPRPLFAWSSAQPRAPPPAAT